MHRVGRAARGRVLRKIVAEAGKARGDAPTTSPGDDRVNFITKGSRAIAGRAGEARVPRVPARV